MSSNKTYVSSTSVASSTPFDNSTNGFTATDVQAAIEEAQTHLFSTEVSATADTTTTSSTDVLLNAMTITPTSGTYLVWFTTTIDHSNQSIPITFSIYAGGTQKADSVRAVITRPNAIGANSLTATVSTQGQVVVNGSQAVEIRWNRGSAGTGTAHQRTLNILRVA